MPAPPGRRSLTRFLLPIPSCPRVDTYSPVAAIATDPFTAGRVHVVVQSGVLTARMIEGATWTLVTVSVANGTLPPVTDLIVDRSTPDVLYVRGSGRFWCFYERRTIMASDTGLPRQRTPAV